MTKQQQAEWLAGVIEDFAVEAERESRAYENTIGGTPFDAGRATAFRLCAGWVRRYLIGKSELD